MDQRVLLSLAVLTGQESTVSDLTGVWSDKTVETVDSEDTWMEAVITEGTISIDWVSDGGDTRWIYWVGTFDSKIEGALPQKVVSERNAEETDRALLASSDDTKEFTFEDGQLSYSQSALGQTRKIVLEKQSAGNGAPFQLVKKNPLSWRLWIPVSDRTEHSRRAS